MEQQRTGVIYGTTEDWEDAGLGLDGGPGVMLDWGDVVVTTEDWGNVIGLSCKGLV
jgi:hypothetical protein